MDIFLHIQSNLDIRITLYKDTLLIKVYLPVSKGSLYQGLTILEKGVYKVVDLIEVPTNIRLFNLRFIDEIKNLGTKQAFKKLRLVI